MIKQKFIPLISSMLLFIGCGSKPTTIYIDREYNGVLISNKSFDAKKDEKFNFIISPDKIDTEPESITLIYFSTIDREQESELQIPFIDMKESIKVSHNDKEMTRCNTYEEFEALVEEGKSNGFIVVDGIDEEEGEEYQMIFFYRIKESESDKITINVTSRFEGNNIYAIYGEAL